MVQLAVLRNGGVGVIILPFSTQLSVVVTERVSVCCDLFHWGVVFASVVHDGA